ncbi:MAG: nucleotidyltransferase domain-containing protein [Alphaproteobacteria bacterium]|nr:nucleotidyltransferase domain-containing protein [Alphaproteobacteria bacterium]
MCMLDFIKQNKDILYQIAQKYNGEEIFIFGSCARKEENEKSDVDFLVKFNDKASLFDQVKMKLDFSDFFKRDVDIVSATALKDVSFYENVYSEMVSL